MEPPSEFRCPISMEPMVDPVLCEDGHTYEKQNIMEWLSRSPTSPLTRQPLNLNNIRPNHALKSAIQRWKIQEMNNKTKSSIITTVAIPVQPLRVIQNPSYTYIQPPQPSYQQQVQAIVTTSEQRQQQQENMNIQRRFKMILLGCSCLIFIFILSTVLSIKNSQHLNDDD